MRFELIQSSNGTLDHSYNRTKNIVLDSDISTCEGEAPRDSIFRVGHVRGEDIVRHVCVPLRDLCKHHDAFGYGHLRHPHALDKDTVECVLEVVNGLVMVGVRQNGVRVLRRRDPNLVSGGLVRVQFEWSFHNGRWGVRGKCGDESTAESGRQDVNHPPFLWLVRFTSCTNPDHQTIRRLYQIKLSNDWSIIVYGLRLSRVGTHRDAHSVIIRSSIRPS